MKNLTSTDLLHLSRKESNARKRIRLLAVSHFLEGKSRTNIAKTLKVARASVNRWVSHYLSDGLQGLESKKPTGRPCKLSNKQLASISLFVEQRSYSTRGGRLNGADVAQYIEKEFNVIYHQDHIYRLLKSLGFSWITSRSKHPKQDEGVQTLFKKLPNGNDPSHSVVCIAR